MHDEHGEGTTESEPGQDARDDRRWAIVTLSAWGAISALLFVRACLSWGPHDPEYSFLAACGIVGGFPAAFLVVSLPFRVWQNLVQPERRRAKLKETLVCIFTFLAVLHAVYLSIATYPPDW